VGRSISCRFFLTPEQTVTILERIAGRSDLHVFVQLERPGIVLERLVEVGDVLARSETPPRLLLTHRDLSPGPEPGTFVGSGVPGLILVSLPFVEGDRFYVGDAGAKFVDEHDPDAAAARALVRTLKRQAAPHKLLARHIPSGATAPAKVGCSEEALRLAKHESLELRQHGVENGDFVATR
jgi:hypothetical protein